MRNSRIYRPMIADPLEDRAVPSRAPTSVAVLIETAVPLPPPVERLQAVREAFANFLQQYTQAYDSIVLAQSPIVGAANPTVNPPTFTTAVQSDLVTLDTALTTAVAAQPTASQLTTQINTDVLGGGANSLETLLLGLPSAYTAASASLVTPVVITPSSNSTATHVATTDLRSVNLPLVAQGGATALGGADSVAGTTVVSTTPLTTQKVRAAFSTFLNKYYSAVQKTLLAPGADGTVNPAANRPAFDAEVSEAVKVLNSTVNTAVGALPASSNLATKAQAALVGGPGSLQAQLSALPTPGNAQPATVGAFGVSSTQAVGNVLALLLGDVSTYVRGVAPGQ